MSNEGTSREDPTGRKSGVPGEWFVCGVIALLSAGFLAGSFAYSTPVQRWPLALSVTVLTLILLYVAYRKVTGTFLQAEVEAGESNQEEETVNDRVILLTAAAFVGFAVLAYGVGFLLATAIFVAGYMLSFGDTRPLTVLGITIGVCATIYLLFGSTLNAPLTDGAWLEYRFDWLPI